MKKSCKETITCEQSASNSSTINFFIFTNRACGHHSNRQWCIYANRRPWQSL